MMEKEYSSAREAYEKYNIDDEYKKEEKILKYVIERIEANKEEIDKILKICKRKYTYEDIKKLIKNINEEKFEYKSEINLKQREDKFVSGKYSTSIGVIAVECFDVLEVLKYMLKGIKTKNAIIISDIEYEENDDKNLLQVIINEALKKFGLESLVLVMPYEECNYELCDKVIYTYEKKQNKEKPNTNKLYVYVEDEKLREEAMREYEQERKNNENVELIEGNIEEVIERLNREVSQGVVIYTTDAKKAYKFVNLVTSYNVFVNATLANKEEVNQNENDLLMTKKIMYELKI